MKRNIIVEKLIKEGLSETTLVKLNDKQLNQLAERMLGETITTTMANIQKSPALQAAAKDKTQTLNVVGEELKGNQKKIDKNHNGKIDADDFKILNKEKEKKGYVVPKPPIPNFNGHKKETPKETKEGNKFSGELAKAKSQHKDTFNVDGKKYDVKEGNYHDDRSKKALEKSKEDFPQLKNIKKCDECGKVMSKCSCNKEKNEVKEWVNNLAESNLYHSFTSKNEIMELIQTKLNESETMTHKFGPKVNQGHNGIPEFMSYDAITSSGPATAPTKPKPTTKPGTKPGTKPSTPYTPKPGPNHNPKALAENK